MKSRWPFTLAGTEYDIVRSAVKFVLSWLYSLNCVSRRAFAFATGMRMPSQSPDGEIVCAVMLFRDSHVLTACTLSVFGATSASTLGRERWYCSIQKRIKENQLIAPRLW